MCSPSPCVSSRIRRRHLLALAAAALASCALGVVYLLLLAGCRCIRAASSGVVLLLIWCSLLLLCSFLVCAGGRACRVPRCHSSVWSASPGLMGFGWSTLSSLGQLVSLSSPAAAVALWLAVVAALSTCTGGALAFGRLLLCLWLGGLCLWR